MGEKAEGSRRAEIPEAILEAIAGKKALTMEYEREGSARGTRKVEPHAVYRTGDQRLMLYAFQIDGVSDRGGLPDWRRFAIEAIKEIALLDEAFALRDDYDPASKEYAAGLIESVC